MNTASIRRNLKERRNTKFKKVQGIKKFKKCEYKTEQDKNDF